MHMSSDGHRSPCGDGLPRASTSERTRPFVRRSLRVTCADSDDRREGDQVPWRIGDGSKASAQLAAGVELGAEWVGCHYREALARIPSVA
jgi:hypothetical protein